jgi:hypothetical protein
MKWRSSNGRIYIVWLGASENGKIEMLKTVMYAIQHFFLDSNDKKSWYGHTILSDGASKDWMQT